MDYTRLGNSDLNVSRICMGCMGFGNDGRGQHSWTIDEEHTREIIKRGLELGVNFYDTAIAYQSGTSEQYVGRALREYAKREDMVSATKFLPRTQDEIKNGITGQQHIEGAAKAVELVLTDSEIAYLEEPYVPHPLAGVMVQNKPVNAKEKHVWSIKNTSNSLRRNYASYTKNN